MKVVQQLSVERSALSVERSGSIASAVDRENPWPGLASFSEDSRDFFFGREKETDELSRLVRRQTLTVLFGQSGLGKSSLLHAGLFPILRETDHLPLYLRLDHASNTPPLAEQVKSALTAAFAAAKAEAPAFRADETLWEYFHRKDVDIWSAKNRLLTPVLAFDQFEEIFTLGRADERCRERSRVFLAELASLVENRAPAAVQDKLDRGELDPSQFTFAKPSCQVILSLREDFLPDLEGLKQAMPALVHNRLRLKKLSGTQALEIVTKPAPHLLADGVAEKIVEFVAGARGGSAERLAELDVEPPLLSVICRELNDRRRALGQAQITADLVSGNRREILTDFYERSVADLPEGMRRFVEDHLLTKSGFRDNLALETALEFPGVARPLIDTLVSRRLLRIEDRLGVQRVELTHDVLAEVVRGARDARQQRVAATEAARQVRRQRWVISGLAVAVAGLLVGAFFGIRAQRRSAEQGGHTDLVLGSRLLDEGKLSEGLAYLVRAGRKNPANDLVGPRLLSTLSQRSYVLPVGAPLSLPGPVLGAAYTADDRWIFTQGEDAVVRIIDAVDFRVVHELALDQKVRRGGVRLARANSAIFAVLLEDNTVLVCDTMTGQPRAKPIRPADRILGRTNLEFRLSPDGRYLTTTGPSGISLWDVAGGELKAALPGRPAYGESIAFSPDGSRVATIRDRQSVSIFSLPDGKEIVATNIADETTSASHVEFSSDGSRLFVWRTDGVWVYDASTGVAVQPKIPIPWQTTYGLWFTRDAKKLIYTTSGRTVHVIDLATGNPIYAPLLHGGNVLQSGARLVADDKVLFTNAVDGILRFWDLETGKLLAEPTLKQPLYAPAAASADGRHAVLFNASGVAYRLRLGGRPAAPLALLRTPENTAFLNFAAGLPSRLSWLTFTHAKHIDVASGREANSGFVLPEPIGSWTRSKYGGTLGPGDVIVVRPRTGNLRAWTVGEAGIASNVELEEADSSLSPNRFGVDSTLQRVAAPLTRSNQLSSNQIGVWDTKTGRRVSTITAADLLATGGATPEFSPDGKRIAVRTNQDSVVHVYDLDTGREVSAFELTGRATLRSFRFNPDSQRLLTSDTWGGVQVWDTTTGRQLHSAQPHRTTVSRFELSYDRRLYASVSLDGSVQVWDAKTDQPVGALLEQSGGADRADFSPDGSRIVTPSSSGSARVWDVHTGLPVTDLLDTEGQAATVVAYSPDGRFVNVHMGGANVKQLVRVWSVPPAGRGVRTPDWLLTLATICAGRRLTDEGKLVDATLTLGKIEDVQRALAAAPADDPYAEWGRWILSDSPTRSIAPGFSLTAAQALKFKGEWLENTGGPALPSVSRPPAQNAPGQQGRKKI
jgi:WD40 repeat protein